MPQAKLKTLIDKFIYFDIAKLAFLLPLFFLPITPEFYDFNKKALLVLSASFIFLLWLARNILVNQVRLTLTPALLPLSVLTITSLVSVFLASPNRQQSFTSRPVIYLSLLLLYIVITTRFNKSRQVNKVISGLIVSASLLGVISFLQFSRISNLIFSSAPAWLKAETFTPAGSLLTLLLLFVPTFFLSILGALRRQQTPSKRLLHLLATILIIVGLVLSLITTSKEKNRLLLPPFTTAWEVAIDNFKNPQNALIGSGPGSFVDSFTARKPVSFNRTDAWNLRFASSRNEPLHLLTTMGLVGLAAYIWLILAALKSAKLVLSGSSLNPTEKAVTAALLASIVLQLLYPSGTLGLFTFVLLLALQQTLRKLETDTKVRDVLLRLFAVSLIKPNQTDLAVKKGRQEILPLALGLPISILILVGLFFGATRIYGAEIVFKKSLDAASENRGTDTYNLQIKAIQKNPREPRYRTAYALTNLALANSLAQQPDLTQTDRQNITQLIQQAIREAKIATQLNPQSAANWETLATVYRNLINVAQGSREWAIASYVQAIQSDPNNPRLRLDLGGIYFGTQDFDQAARFFEQATLLKPDWANAHYNLSAAYREKGELEKAIEEMKLVLQFLDPKAADYAKAQSELQNLNSRLANPPANQQVPPAETQLSEPEPLPTPVPGVEEIQLPEDAGPEVATESAIPEPSVPPTPTASPTPQPTPTP